ncbi:MAG: amino acid-binding protein [Nocardioides sp.]
MSYLLRLALPNVPGSLGKVAGAIGSAGGDINAIQIVEATPEGAAIDDVLLDLPNGALPDAIVSACNALDGVEVLWISRYAVGGTLSLDLEAVEEMTSDPDRAMQHLVAIVPLTFRADWAARVRRADDTMPEETVPEKTMLSEVVEATRSAPVTLPWPGLHITHLKLEDEQTLAVSVPVSGPADDPEALIVGRRGGPEFLDSELARLRHLVALAGSIARSSAGA